MPVERYAPRTISDLRELLKGENIYVLGGGTDLSIQIRAGKKSPRGLICLGGLAEAQGIRRADSAIEIGASVTMSELALSAELSGAYAALSQAAAGVGSEQIRNAATIGGNIANAAPGADTLPALLLLDAEVQVAGPEGIEWRKLQSILPGAARLCSNEVLLSIRLPLRDNAWTSAFHKLGSRRTMTISKLSIALGLQLENGVIHNARAYAGAVGLCPLEVESVGALLKGRVIKDNDTARILGEALEAFVRRTIPNRPSCTYKAWAAKAVAADVMANFACV